LKCTAFDLFTTLTSRLSPGVLSPGSSVLLTSPEKEAPAQVGLLHKQAQAAPGQTSSHSDIESGLNRLYSNVRDSSSFLRQLSGPRSNSPRIVCAANRPRKRGPGTGGFYTPKRKPLQNRPRPKRKEKPPEPVDPNAPPGELDLSKFKWSKREPEPEPVSGAQQRWDMLEEMDSRGVNAVSDDDFVKAFTLDKPYDPFFDALDAAAAPRYKGGWSLKKARELKKREKMAERRGEVPTQGGATDVRIATGRKRAPGERPNVGRGQEEARGGRGDAVEAEVVVGPGFTQQAEEEQLGPKWWTPREVEKKGRGGRGGPAQLQEKGLGWGVSDDTFAEIQKEFGAHLDEVQGSDTDSEAGFLEGGDELEKIQGVDDVDLSGFAEGYLQKREASEKRKAKEEEKKRSKMPDDMARILSWPPQPPPDPTAREFADEDGYLTQDETVHEDIEYESQFGFSKEWFHDKLGYNDVFRSSFPEEQQSLARRLLAAHLKGVRKMEPGLADLVATKCNGFLDKFLLRKPEKGSAAEGEPDLEKRMEIQLNEMTKFDFLWAYFEAVGLDQERTKLGVMFQPITMTVPLAHRAVTYLREGLRFSNKEIHAVIVDSPHLLRWQPDAYRKRREFFPTIGWDEKELIHTDPAVYSKDVEQQLRPMVELLAKSGVKDVNRAVKEKPIILGKNTIQGLEKKMELLRLSGFTPDDVNKLVVNDPEALSLNLEKVLPQLFNIMQKWGFTERQSVDVVVGWPEVLTQRRIFFNDRLKFLIEENGRTPEEIAAWPQVMWYDVLDRLAPCFSLAERYGYLDRGLQFILQPEEEVFTSQRHLHPWLGDPEEFMHGVMKRWLKWSPE
jgi:hypothetical protein